MAKEEALQVEGRVIENKTNGRFDVEFEMSGHKHVVLAHVCGKMRMHHIHVKLGDYVTVEVSPYDLTRGIVKYRHKSKPAPVADVSVSTDQNQGE